MSEITSCKGCAKTEAQVDMCRICIYQFTVFGKKCPQETSVPEQPQFEFWKCPECGIEYTISWVWCTINRRPKQA